MDGRSGGHCHMFPRHEGLAVNSGHRRRRGRRPRGQQPCPSRPSARRELAARSHGCPPAMMLSRAWSQRSSSFAAPRPSGLAGSGRWPKNARQTVGGSSASGCSEGRQAQPPRLPRRSTKASSKLLTCGPSTRLRHSPAQHTPAPMRRGHTAWARARRYRPTRLVRAERGRCWATGRPPRLRASLSRNGAQPVITPDTLPAVSRSNSSTGLDALPGASGHGQPGQWDRQPATAGGRRADDETPRSPSHFPPDDGAGTGTPRAAPRPRYSDRELRQLQADEQAWASVQERLLALGAQAINDHVNNSGRCKRCQTPFPCAAAQQAELVLGAF